jgi:alpha-L-fucosidase
MKQGGLLIWLLLWQGVLLAQGNWRKVSEELIFTKPPFAASHAPTIVELASGGMMVSFFAGTHEGHPDVSVWQTEKRARKWTQPRVVATGAVQDTVRFPCWNPVLFRPANGPLQLYYKVGPNPREWWGMVQTSADDGNTWSSPVRLPDGILGPIKNKPIQLGNGTILSPSSTETATAWKTHIEQSSDGGKTWKRIPIDTSSYFKVIQPSILQYGNNRLQVLCRSDQDRIVQAWSEDNGNSWSSFSTLELPNPNSGIDAVTLRNGMQLLVYNPTIKGKEWFNNRGKLNVAISKDGIRWSDIMILENGAQEEYSYPAVIQDREGRVHIVYTYNRKNIKHVVLAQEH